MFIATFLLAVFAPLLDSLAATTATAVKYAGLVLVGVVCSLLLWHGSALWMKVAAGILVVDNVLLYLAVKGVITLPSPTPPVVKPVVPTPAPKKV
jgi:apolipoprotein N-acyltransferase